MKTIYIVLVLTLGLSWSCSSKIYLPRSNPYRLNQFDEIIILKNDYSYIIPFHKYPGYNEIRYMVKDTVPAIEPVFSLIKKELRSLGYTCTIYNSLPEIDHKAIYISYQDYWEWDFKRYMHLMVMNVFNPNDELIFRVVSYSNHKGFHNFPTPTKQIPLMIEELSKHLN